ncbi:aldo/keto reductase [Cellulomonas fimi]|uniref:aldo/keto reductase n=1 Tax=Cellulomonas fimi TaxID=1708 RepID=UPI0023593B52|nr:aldo/keto reductase [Cellulomonas fimi]
MRTLGAHGPTISPVGLGGWQAGGGRTWGPNSSDREVVSALRTGFDAGADWIDTAEVYAQGRSEEIVGRAVAPYPDVRVFTKVGPQPDGTGVRAAEVVRAAEGSLRRLGRDVLDLYQVHWRDHEVPIEETWTAMLGLVDRGLARWVGLSNVTREDLDACARIGHVDSLQIQGSLLHRSELDWALPRCAELGTGVICYGPLAYGLLGGHRDGGYTDWRSGGYGMDDFFVEENFHRFFADDVTAEVGLAVSRVEAGAAELGLTAAQASLAWLLAQPGVTGVIAGSRNPAHILENVSAGSVTLTPEQLVALEQGSVVAR